MKTLIIIPAFNEQDNIVQTIEDIKTNVSNVDYIVINDCSTDETKKVLKSNNINHIDLPVNLGIGGGVQTGYKYALENEYDIAIQFDGDGQHSAKYLRALVLPIEKGSADIVIGSRFINNEGFQSSWQRRCGINFLSGLIKLLTGVKVKDVTSGMRAVNRKYIEVYAKEYAQDYPEPEALMQAAMLEAKVCEVPVEMMERQAGESSIKAWKTIYYMFKVSIAIVLHNITFAKKGKRG